MSMPVKTNGQGFSPGGPLGLTSEPAAAAAAQAHPQAGLGPAMDPSTLLDMSEATARHLTAATGVPPNHQQLQQQQPSAQVAPDAAETGAATCNSCKQEPADALSDGSALPGQTGPVGGLGGLMPGASGPASEIQLPPDPNDPEALAAALGARIVAAGATIIFEKALTASDVSGGGRVVVPKSVAEQYFPKLEQPSGVTISATDLDGRTYTFKWRFWVNNSSRMYLLEGAGELHRNYGLEVGDVMVFAQKPDGALVVAGRVASKSDLMKKPPAGRRAAAATPGGGAGQGPRAQRDSRPARPAPRPLPAPSGAEPPSPAGAGPAARPAGAIAAAAAAAAGVQDGGGAGRGRKRKALLPVADVRLLGGRGGEGGAVSLAVLEMEAPSDGVFRAVVLQHVAPVPLGVALARNNRWTATLEVAGEVYQAFFDTRDDAVEAVTAAGASL